jgi:hypothetical protein
MNETDKIIEIREMLDASPRFQKEYGAKLKLIKYVLPLMDSEMIDKMYGFLVVEKNCNQK